MFEIEHHTLTSAEVAKPQSIGKIRYPFRSLEPGQCFYVEADANGQAHRKAKASMWAHNRNQRANLSFMLVEDGRLCIFNPLPVTQAIPADIQHPTQLELVLWLKEQAIGFKYEFGEQYVPRFKQLSGWIDELIAKDDPAKSYKWTLKGKTLIVEVIASEPK